MKDKFSDSLDASDIFGLIFCKCAAILYSADDNLIHAIISKRVHTTFMPWDARMMSNPLISTRHSPTARPAELYKVKPAQF